MAENTHLIIVLSNGLRVANFSSPHEFQFVDGSILPAVSNELSKKLSLQVEEETYSTENIKDTDNKYISIKIKFTLDPLVIEELSYWHQEHKKGNVDVVIVPRPCLDAIRESGTNDEMINKFPFRTIRVADRLLKTVCIDKFCI
jgi:hypothetical protein